MEYIGQEGSACALISLLNAAIYHNLPAPRPGTDEFEELVDLVGARHGGAICSEKALKPLGLTSSVVDLHPYNLQDGLPVAFSVHTPEWGFHSTLAVDVCCLDDGYYLTLVNLRASELVSSVKFRDFGNILTLGRLVGDQLAASIQPCIND